MTTSYPFFPDKLKTRTKIKNLRHSSLKMDVTNKTPKFQTSSYDSKSEILVQKMKVKNKIVFCLFKFIPILFSTK